MPFQALWILNVPALGSEPVCCAETGMAKPIVKAGTVISDRSIDSSSPVVIFDYLRTAPSRRQTPGSLSKFVS
jgi:hypothetical protein